MFLIINSENVLDLLIKSIRTLPCRYQNTAVSVSKLCRVGTKTLPCRYQNSAVSVPKHYRFGISSIYYEQKFIFWSLMSKRFI